MNSAISRVYDLMLQLEADSFTDDEDIIIALITCMIDTSKRQGVVPESLFALVEHVWKEYDRTVDVKQEERPELN